MTRDTEDFTDTAAEPQAGDDTEHLSLREELANALADAGEGAAAVSVKSSVSRVMGGSWVLPGAG